MMIKVNGDAREMVPGQTVRDLMIALGFKDKPAAVEVNRQVVPRKVHETTMLHDGDVVEVVTFVGGG